MDKPAVKTFGQVFEEIFPGCEVLDHTDSILGMTSGKDIKVYTDEHSYFQFWAPSSWWNSPYQQSSQLQNADE